MMKAFLKGAYLIMIILSVLVASATTIQDCKNQNLDNCIVTESSTVASSDSPFYLQNVTINSGVTITVNYDNGCGYYTYDSNPWDHVQANGGGCFSLYADNLMLQGGITANGQNNVNGPDGLHSAGASGGTIRLFVTKFSGDGTLTANGGNGVDSFYDAGGGAAGSIVVYAQMSGFTGQIIGKGGWDSYGDVSSHSGGPGGYGGQGHGYFDGAGSGGTAYNLANPLRGIYVGYFADTYNLVLQNGVGATDGYLYGVGAYQSKLNGLGSHVSSYTLTVLAQQSDSSPASSVSISLTEYESETVNASGASDSFGLYKTNLTLNENKDYSVKMLNSPVGAKISYMVSSSAISATHIMMNSLSASPQVDFRKLYVKIFDPAHNALSDQHVIVKGPEGTQVAEGYTNASGMLFFWLPQNDLDTASTRMRYKVVVEAGTYPQDIIFENVTVPQYLPIGSNSTTNILQGDMARDMSVGGEYIAEMTLTPDSTMNDLNFIEELPQGFTIEGNVMLTYSNISGEYSCSVSPYGNRFSVNSTGCNLLGLTKVFGPGELLKVTYKIRAPTNIGGESQNYTLDKAGVWATLL